VDLREEKKNKIIYGVISIIVIILIIITIIFSSNSITEAYIDDKYISDGWSEDINDRDYGERLFGLEKQASFTYRINDNYPAYVSVTTIKTLFMMNEKELFDKTIETIMTETKNQNILLNASSEITGSRVLNNTHKTNYVIYDGTDNSKNISEEIKIIGESWNCARSGTSIICIGYAQITDNAGNNTSISLNNWARILKDKDGTFINVYGSNIFQGENGLIFNVICH